MLPRLYRQAPLNSIWEGSGNIQCLDVLRALQREPTTWQALDQELGRVRGMDTRLDAWADELAAAHAGGLHGDAGARHWVERLALALQAAVLLESGSPLADAFIGSRLDGRHGVAFGTLPAGTDFAAILQRALPRQD